MNTFKLTVDHPYLPALVVVFEPHLLRVSFSGTTGADISHFVGVCLQDWELHRALLAGDGFTARVETIDRLRAVYRAVLAYC